MTGTTQLRDIMHPELLTRPPESSLSTCAQVMRERGVGSILIANGDGVLGIWTESDALRLDFGCGEWFDRPVSEVMSQPVKSLPADLTLSEAAHFCKQNKVRHILVTEGSGGRPLGLVSQTDIVNHQGLEMFVRVREIGSVVRGAPPILPAVLPLAAAIDRLRESGEDAAVVRDDARPDRERFGIITGRDVVRVVAERRSEGCVGDVASFPLVTLEATDSLFSARRFFLEKQVRHLGVVDAKGVICGLLSYSDILAIVESGYVQELQSALADHTGRLRESQQALKLAVKVAESSQQAIVITDASGYIESVNPAFSAITGWTPDEVIGQTPRLLRSTRHDRAFAKRISVTLSRDGRWSGEVWGRRRNGDDYPTLTTISAVVDDDQRLVHYVTVFSDISDAARSREALVASRQALERKSSLLTSILDTVPICVFVKRDDGQYQMVNRAMADLFGIDKSALERHYASDFLSEEIASRVARDDTQVLAKDGVVAREENIQINQQSHTLLTYKQGVTIGGERLLIGAAVDISQRKRAEAAQQRERDFLRKVASGAELGETLDALCQNVEAQVGGAFCSVMLLEDGGFLRHVAGPNLPEGYVRAVDGTKANDGTGSCGTAVARREQVASENLSTDPKWRGFSHIAEQFGLRACLSTPIFSSEGEVLGIFTLYYGEARQFAPAVIDAVNEAAPLAAIAIERARILDRLHRMATVDVLTGLFNRQQFLTLAERERQRVARTGKALSVLMFDIDFFKQVNDTYGHAAGDQALRLLAARFLEVMRTVDLVGRLGGEEFAAILPDTPVEGAGLLAERLREAVGGEPLDLNDGVMLPVTLSVGVATFRKGESLDKAMARADKALYEAKHGGRNQVALAR